MFKGYFLERLRQKQPEANERYDFSAWPDSFRLSGRIVLKCNTHGDFTTTPLDVIYDRGCGRCEKDSGKWIRINSLEKLIQKSKSLYGEKFDYSLTEFNPGGTKFKITCSTHGIIEITVREHLNFKTGCPKCDEIVYFEEKAREAIHAAKLVHGDKYDYSKVALVRLVEKVEIVCPKHGSFWQSLSDHVHKENNCPGCAIDKNRLTKDQFIARSREIHGTIYDYSQVSFKTIACKIIITCPEHGEFTQRVGSHLQGNRCIKCHLNDQLLPMDDFICAARKIHGDKYDYSKVVYKGNKTKVEIICPIHGAFWVKPNTHTSCRTGCGRCSESKGETAVLVALTKYGINFVREYGIPNYRFRYDFYLPDFNIFIEYHGHQHYRPVELFGGEKNFETQKLRDKIKKRLVTQAGGQLIVLNYLTLKQDVVEAALLVKLKKIFQYWFVENQSIRVFKYAQEVYSHYGVPPTVSIRALVGTVMELHPEVKILF